MNSSSESTSFAAAANRPILEMSGICKRFPGVIALDEVALAVDAGEVVGLIGENGAGKSTLMKILAGILRPDAGTVRMDRNVASEGIAIIHQELNVLDNLDVAGNVFLGREPTWGGPAKLIDRKKMEAETESHLSRLGVNISPRALVKHLSTAQRQLVEIVKALSLNARVVIMDEPTSSLTTSETDRLFEVIRDLRSHGVCIIYLSHRLSEVERICDRVIVLRDGRNAGILTDEEIDRENMVQLMVGRNVPLPSRKVSTEAKGGEAVHQPYFEVRNLRTHRYPNTEVSFAIRTGEILGLGGLVGAGRTELAEAIFGVEPPLAGSLFLDNKRLALRSVRDAMNHGIYLIPEDRRRTGVITEMALRENVTLAALGECSGLGFIRRDREVGMAKKVVAELSVKCPSIDAKVATLSGGNQQKVVLGKWLSIKPKVIIFDEPTRGVDVGSKADIHRLMTNLARQGIAILMISSDMEEILGNSDRIAVMHEGRITGILERPNCTEQAVMRLAVV